MPTVTTTAPNLPIWWIASYPKSGNTWVRALLTAYLTGECHVNRLLGYQDTDRYANRVVSPADDLGLREEYLLRPAAILHLWHSYELTGPLLMKTHNVWGDIDGVPTVPQPLMEAAIYVVRDPRDVCMSLSRHMGITPTETARYMNNGSQILRSHGGRQVLSSWSAHVGSWLKADANVTVVSYEELKQSTADAFEVVLSGLGHDTGGDRSRVEGAVEAARLERLRSQEEADGFVGIGEQDRFFGGPEEAIPADVERTIVEDHGDVIERLGYTAEPVPT